MAPTAFRSRRATWQESAKAMMPAGAGPTSCRSWHVPKPLVSTFRACVEITILRFSLHSPSHEDTIRGTKVRGGRKDASSACCTAHLTQEGLDITSGVAPDGRAGSSNTGSHDSPDSLHVQRELQTSQRSKGLPLDFRNLKRRLGPRGRTGSGAGARGDWCMRCQLRHTSFGTFSTVTPRQLSKAHEEPMRFMEHADLL